MPAFIVFDFGHRVAARTHSVRLRSLPGAQYPPIVCSSTRRALQCCIVRLRYTGSSAQSPSSQLLFGADHHVTAEYLEDFAGKALKHLVKAGLDLLSVLFFNDLKSRIVRIVGFGIANRLG